MSYQRFWVDFSLDCKFFEEILRWRKVCKSLRNCQIAASGCLKKVQQTGQIPGCSFYLPVSMSRNHAVVKQISGVLLNDIPQQRWRQFNGS